MTWGGGYRSCRYLDFQHVVASYALVMHLMVGVVCVTARLVLNKSEATNVSTRYLHLAFVILTLTVGSTLYVVLECRSGPDVHTFRNHQYEVRLIRCGGRSEQREVTMLQRKGEGMEGYEDAGSIDRSFARWTCTMVRCRWDVYARWEEGGGGGGGLRRCRSWIAGWTYRSNS